MSGSSGGGYYKRNTANNSCDNISTKGTISSPDQSVLDTLKVNDTLDIVTRSAAGPLQAVTKDGHLLGSVFTSSAQNIILCISDGHEFAGKITLIIGGYCEILIRNA